MLLQQNINPIYFLLNIAIIYEYPRLLECDREAEPRSIQEDQQFFDQAKKILEKLDGAVQNFTEDATEFCGTTDKNLFADIIATSLKYLCSVIGLSIDVLQAFQCKTWMPLYYNTGK
ncbi:MAG: hypothetical protein ACI8RD_008562 [Bacillariaceae sp.]|jgi:hypothetical protein